MTEQTVMDQAVKVINNKEGKYLTFSLAGEEYGLGILKVKEIIGMMPITVVPQTPPYIKGSYQPEGKGHPRYRFTLKIFYSRSRIYLKDMYYSCRNISGGKNDINGNTGRFGFGST